MCNTFAIFCKVCLPGERLPVSYLLTRDCAFSSGIAQGEALNCNWFHPRLFTVEHQVSLNDLLQGLLFHDSLSIGMTSFFCQMT